MPVAVSLGAVSFHQGSGLRLHTLLDLRGNIPTFIHISDGRTHEVNVLDMLIAEAGAFYVMDRGYLDFGRLFTLHQAGAFFVTRAKRGMNAHRVYSMPADRETGVICDQRIMLDGFYISQHLRIKRFIGTSENAVKTQIWCAVATYVLIAIVKRELHLDSSLYTLLQITSVSVFEKTPLSEAFAGSLFFQEQSGVANQLNLFDI